MVLAVLTWVNVWNDFLWPLVMIQRNSIATLTLGILPDGAVRFAEYASHSTLIEQARQECAAHPDCHIQLQFDVH